MHFPLFLTIALSLLVVNILAMSSNNLVVIGLVERGVEQIHTCTRAVVRKEWRALSTSEKKSYITAVKCLTTKKAISGLPSTINRFDDHHAVHSNQTPNIHWVGHFVLWHRYFTATYEKALRDECGYTGGQPYWNWSRDVSADNASTAVFSASVFDPKTGFGGNGPYIATTDAENPFNITGRLGGGCVKDGPFTYPSFKVNVGGSGSHCLTRDFVPNIMNTFGQQKLVDYVLAAKDYTEFAKRIENVPSFTEPNIHGSGHFGIGGVLGTMGDAYNSPRDPLFYLHHSNLDRILTYWQSLRPAQRLFQVGGPIVPFDYTGKNVTLDFKVGMGNLAANVTLASLLDTEGGVLCYKYANLTY